MLKITIKQRKEGKIVEKTLSADDIIIRDQNDNIIGVFLDFGNGYVLFAHVNDKDFGRVLMEAGIGPAPKINRLKQTKSGLILPE